MSKNDEIRGNAGIGEGDAANGAALNRRRLLLSGGVTAGGLAAFAAGAMVRR